MISYWENAAIQDNTNYVTKCVIFKLAGDLLNPEEITSRLKIKPTFAYAKGTPVFPGEERKSRRMYGLWALSSKGQLLTSSLEQHITFSLDQIEPVYSEIIDLIEPCSMITYFDCYLGFTNPKDAILVTPLILRRIANLNAYLSFSIEEFEEEEIPS